MLANVDKEFQELKQFMDCLNEFDLNMTYYQKLEVFNILNQINQQGTNQETNKETDQETNQESEQELFEKYINYN